MLRKIVSCSFSVSKPNTIDFKRILESESAVDVIQCDIPESLSPVTTTTFYCHVAQNELNLILHACDQLPYDVTFMRETM